MSRRHGTTVEYVCPSCGRELEISVEPITPARTWGPPESCHPEEGGDIDPEECDCGHLLDYAKIHSLARD